MPTLSTVIAEVQKRYTKEGLKVFGGFSPFITGFARKSMFNFIARDEMVLSTSGGISNDEAIFMHGICEQLQPASILVIGNSYGFSAVFLSVSCPDATLVAFDKFRTEGIKTTNRMLEGLEKKWVIQASTPDDIPTIIDKYFVNRKVDFVLIDAVHTNEMQTREFEVLDAYLSDNAVVVFHDVLSCNLLPSFRELKSRYPGYRFHLVTKTSSGVGIAVKGEIPEVLQHYLDYYCFDANEIHDFNSLVIKHQNDAAIDFYEASQSKFRFPPHPQL